MAFARNVTEFGQFEKANANPSKDTASLDYIYKAATDAQEALRLVRTHAAEWHVDPHKVGFLGFSAGGGVALAAVIRNTDPVTMPAFLATAYGPSLVDVVVPAGAPPVFICTNADHMNVAAGCLALFLEWKKAGVPAELHIFEKGKAGFSLDKSGTSSDMWNEAFFAWLKGEGF
jgi:acetyl esterase/lipase